MATILTIDRNAVLRAAALDTAVVSNQSEATALIADKQAGIETQLSTAALATAPGDPALAALLTLGVTELLAAELLAQRARAVGASEAITAGGVVISHVPAHGPALRQVALERLRPYLRRALPAVTRAAVGSPGGLSLESQEAMFGIPESDRRAAGKS
jgi:hypothetical protein